MSRALGFFFNDTATTEIYTLSLHDAPSDLGGPRPRPFPRGRTRPTSVRKERLRGPGGHRETGTRFLRGARTCSGDSPDRKSTRLNSSHANISYAVFCLQKKKTTITPTTRAV